MSKFGNVFLKITSCFCALFAAGAAAVLLICVKNTDGGAEAAITAVLPICAAVIFLIINTKSENLKYKPAIFCAVSAGFILYGIFTTPYNPCYDSIDLHTILNRMMNKEPVGLWHRAYMDYTVNNKLTVLIYLPLARLFGNVTAGVRVMNGALLAASAAAISSAAARISEKRRYGALLISSACSPFLLLAGPYIYLPSIFLTAVSVRCVVGKSLKSKILLMVFSSILFALRPTAFGVVPVMLTVDIFLHIGDKKRVISAALCLAVSFLCAFGMKAAVGEAIYKSGAHKYPALNSAAMVWTFELGTRPNGENTGGCSYNQWVLGDDYDEIQKKFYELWSIYQNDEQNGTESFDEITEKQNEIKGLLWERMKNMSAGEYMENIINKTRLFLRNDNIPYYFRSNVTDKHFDISVDYDKKYFAYMNALLLLFSIAALINLMAVFGGKDKSDGVITAAALSAAAVMTVMILFTEVSKKYIFDFYVPMMLCVSFVFSGRLKKAPAPVSVIAAALCAAGIITAHSSYKIDVFSGAKTSVTESNGGIVMDIKLRKPCDENYFVQTNADGAVSLYGKDSIRIRPEPKSFDALTVCGTDGKTLHYSSEIIE